MVMVWSDFVLNLIKANIFNAYIYELSYESNLNNTRQNPFFIYLLAIHQTITLQNFGYSMIFKMPCKVKTGSSY